MNTRKARTAALANHGDVGIAAQLDELRTQVDATYARRRAQVEAEHTAVDAEIAALLARLHLLQVQVGESWARTMSVTT